MPYRDPEQQREYARQWVASRRAEWFQDKDGNAKLTWEDVRAIRASELPHRTIARLYPVDEKTIRSIRKYQIWVP